MKSFKKPYPMADDGKKWGGGSLEAPPYSDAEPARMSTSQKNGKRGSTFSLTSDAKYGVDGSQDVPRMSRTAKKGKSGSTFKAPSNRNDYAVGGHSAPVGKGYAVGGV